eukprot:TRINITY_DN5076_c0_g1_i1.p1 TRINITY_DN5076_c0_g1~~TRINITY_DN5076_c0_g1_i1.p1  ORF type:complete len:398 (-),score=67.75 TRINITY_DN5076_c0_g1_i1:60-1253(-)
MSEPKLIIIGAGLGGLVLAQVLRKNAVPFEIFERDEGPGSREQGWSLNIEWVLQPLHDAILPIDPPIFDMAVNAVIGGGVNFCVFNGYTGENVIDQPSKKGSKLRANRSKLRTWLSDGLDIKWGKKYQTHETSSGSVRVTFEDGSVAEGAALVGADGILSRVRGTLFDNLKIPFEKAPISIIVGTRILSKEEYESYADFFRSGALFFAFGDNSRMLVSIRDMAADLSKVEVIWYFSWLSDGNELSKDEKVAEGIKRVSPYIEPLRKLFRETSRDNMYLDLVIRSILLPDIKPGLATLLGDAAHAMTPFRGEGAQHAMLDSVKLGTLLAEAYKELRENGKDIDFASLFKKYEEEMLTRGREAVIQSRSAIRTFHRPIEEHSATAMKSHLERRTPTTNV